MKERKTDYTNDAQQRLVKVIFVLFGDVVNGVAPGAIVAAVGCSAPTVTRDLANLRVAGIAERDEETGMWRLTPRLPQQALKVFTAMDRAQQRLDESRQRFSRNPD